MEKHKGSPRVIELPKNLPVEGFTPEREVFVRGMLEKIGLPLDRVSKVTFKPNTSKTEYVLGSAHQITGEVTFYKRMEGIPEIAQVGTAAHELAHVNSFYIEENVNAYGGERNMEKARGNAILVAAQTATSHKFLNGYHKALYQEFILRPDDVVAQEKFIEETNAIMMELRFTNPKHLEEVLKAQDKDTFKSILGQIDSTLLDLMPNLNRSKTELNQHIANLKNSYKTTV